MTQIFGRSAKVALIIGVMLTTCGLLHAAAVSVVKDKAPAPQLNVGEFDRMVYASESTTPVYNYFKDSVPVNALSYLAGASADQSAGGASTGTDGIGIGGSDGGIGGTSSLPVTAPPSPPPPDNPIPAPPPSHPHVDSL